MTDCWDFCRALCPVAVLNCEHKCNAWSYNNDEGTCLTFDSYPVCYDTITDDGWWSGATCPDSNKSPIKELTAITGTFEYQTFSYGPFGNLTGTLNSFNDQQQATDVSEILIVTGTNTDVRKEVITGIQFTYRGDPRPPTFHGQKGPKNITCTVQEGTYFNSITVRSLEDQTSDPAANLVYYLQFQSTDSQMKPANGCFAGSSTIGNEKKIPTNANAKRLNSISGDTKGTGISSVIADLTFLFV